MTEFTYLSLRFGEITPVVVSTVNGIACEIAYHGGDGTIIGYWAYGSFDPSYPYRGD